jgi:hypothetical protein
MHKRREDLVTPEQYPEAFKYFKYLMKKHGIKRSRLLKREGEVEEKTRYIQKIPQREFREAVITLKNHHKPEF